MAFGQLLVITDELREKCPWDQKQTMKSLRHLTIEEVFELSEAIMGGEMEHIKEELGDLLLHIVLYARIASEQHSFSINQVIQALCKKLIHRHPHIYGQEKAEDAQSVKKNWEKRKLQEKGKQSLVGGVPRTLPSLIKAMRIQEKAYAIGLDWQDKATAWQKIQGAVQALTQEHSQRASIPTQQQKVQEEFGELLFLLVTHAKFMAIDPEEALEKANKRFINQLQYVEQRASQQNKPITQLSTEELRHYWEEAKQQPDLQ
ncbi:MAG: nucleoside triphosphate pyrophosphohydrolase [Amoebophilaceae bacterium]|nr:nucleoside triphosphate pyrophosphohydrolase [Amoebophilaceae bacterium]